MNFIKKLFGGKQRLSLEKILNQLTKQEIRLNYTKSDSSLPVGTSKIGGKPDLPADFVWPEYEGADWQDQVERRPLSFLAQINLKDVASFDKEGLLPKSGLLSFFYETVTMCWGFNAEDRGCAGVFYFPEGTELVSTALPQDLEQDGILPECALSFEPHISLPGYESFAEDESVEALCEWEEYDEQCEAMGYEVDDMGDRTKLLGYPDVIQNPMEEECERVTRGYNCGSSEDFGKVSREEKEDIRRRAKDWILLFQMGTVAVDGYEMMFGDCGHIYFWIRKEDLLARRFDRIWLILQCS